MDHYSELKNRIDKYENLNNVMFTEQTISLYDLKRLLDNKFKRLRHIMNVESFINVINKDNIELQGIGCLQPSDRCSSILFSNDKMISKIIFGFNEDSSAIPTRFIRICKDDDSDELYFEGKECDREFIERYISRILEIFAVLEEFSRLFQGKINFAHNVFQQEFTDGFFVVSIKCYGNGNVSLAVAINEESDPNNIYKRTWLNRERLFDYVNERSDIILKKISVKINMLHIVFRLVVEEYIREQNERYAKRRRFQ